MPMVMYLHDAVDTIIHTKAAASTGTQFALALTAHSMAFKEATYLYGLMQ